MLSVLTLNLRFGLADDGPNSWRHRKRCFPSLFKKYRADFIGLQEVNDFQTDFLKKILPEYNFIGRRSPAPPFWQNNIIFYKRDWKCVYNKHIFLSPTPMIPSRFRESRWPRQCTIGTFRNDNRMLICVNTHFDFDVSVQLESARIIMEQLCSLSPDLPAILIGDFNATPSSPCYMIFTGQDQKLKSEGIYFKNIFKKSFPGTHHKFTGNVNSDHIDWILYRGRIIPEDHVVIHDTIDGVYPSDHFPLYATFKWEN